MFNKTNVFKRMRGMFAILAMSSLLVNCSTTPTFWEGRFVADDQGGPRSAFEVFSMLQESATSFNARGVLVDGEAIDGFDTGVTWGAEKEASSGLITRIMGPPDEHFRSMVRDLSEEDRKAFLSDFLDNYVKNANGYRTYRTEEGNVIDLARDVLDHEGNPKLIDLSELQGIDYKTADLSVLEEKWEKFLVQTDGRPMTFIKPQTRMKLFKAQLPGLSGNPLGRYYRDWIPNFGDAQKYILDAHNHGGGMHGGWEIGFIPQQTYGEFEEMVAWFRKSLKNAGQLFQAPGHQRMVFKEHPNLPKGQLSELYRAIQALIVVDGIKGKTGIEAAHYKDVQTDSSLKQLYTYRGVIRLEGDRWGSGTHGVEFRAGTKDLRLARFYQTALAARVGSNDFSGMSDIDDYKLFTGSYIDADDIASRFGIADDIAEKAERNLSGITDEFILPLWHWESDGLPFLSKEKKKLIHGMSKGFMEQVAALEGSSDQIKASSRALLQEWVRATNLSEELHNYIRPKRGFDMTDDLLFFHPNERGLARGVSTLVDEMIENATGSVDEDIERKILDHALTNPNISKAAVADMVREDGFDVTTNRVKSIMDHHGLNNVAARNAKLAELGNSGGFPAGMVNVNEIDLGIEFSGRMPLRLRADFTPDKLADNKKAWLATYSDFTQEERENFIKKVAADLKDQLGGGTGPVKVDSDGHGHGLDISYEIRDSQNRKWIVEWDGVGRSYTEAGEVVPNSMRGGSIELVTPKFTPLPEEMKAVYSAFEMNNVLPRLQSGGGHINIDLAAFEGKPKQLAKFLSVFHEHRGVISLMFQRVNRLRNAEPAEVSSNLAQKLKNFNGSEDDLKKLLYNEGYFNKRYGRKSRYIQIDMSAYFQDIIPEQFISDDFDIQNPTVEWRRQFRVDPKIRKMEFRMFNAPRDPAEAALQVRLVRALLHKSLNDEEIPSGIVQSVDHESYLKNPDKAYADLKKMCDELQLDINDFRPAVAEGLSETDLATRSVFFESLDEKLRLHPKQPGWGEALDQPRTTGISSEGRQWVRGPADELNTMSNSHRIQAAAEASRIRDSIVPDRMYPVRFKRTDSCVDAISPFIQ